MKDTSTFLTKYPPIVDMELKLQKQLGSGVSNRCSIMHLIHDYRWRFLSFRRTVAWKPRKQCQGGTGNSGQGGGITHQLSRTASPAGRYLHHKNTVYKKYHRVKSKSKVKADTHTFLRDKNMTVNAKRNGGMLVIVKLLDYLIIHELNKLTGYHSCVNTCLTSERLTNMKYSQSTGPRSQDNPLRHLPYVEKSQLWYGLEVGACISRERP